MDASFGIEARFTDFLTTIGNPLRYFTPRELLYLGGEDNSFPPESLWPNIVSTALFADLIRHEYGHPLRIGSAYRSPTYNAAIGGASQSQHVQFRALDLAPIGGPGAGVLHDIAVRIRAHGPLKWLGGIGSYASFIHIDNRGVNTDWRG